MTKDYFIEKKSIVYEKVTMERLDSDVLDEIDIIEEEDEPDSKDKNKDKNKDKDKDKKKDDDDKKNGRYDYIGTIEIPRINLKKGFVSPNSKYNNIEYNVTIIKPSDFPDKKRGSFVLAAHSGTGPKAIFRYLYKVNKKDKIYITYKGVEYTYVVKKIYTQKKGLVTIFRNPKKTSLTLITCTKDKKNLQTLYIAERD